MIFQRAGSGSSGHKITARWAASRIAAPSISAAGPSARESAAVAYDAATGTAVLFGGWVVTRAHNGNFGDTWTWG